MLIYYADDIKRQGGLLTPSILILQERWLVKRELYKWIDLSLFFAYVFYVFQIRFPIRNDKTIWLDEETLFREIETFAKVAIEIPLCSYCVNWGPFYVIPRPDRFFWVIYKRLQNPESHSRKPANWKLGGGGTQNWAVWVREYERVGRGFYPKKG